MRKPILSGLLLIAALAAGAEETGVTNLVARQRWPWSPVVDIDFTVVSSNTAVKFIAQYDGAEPFELAEKDLTGDFANTLQPGLHHVAWDPVRAGLGTTELKNFRVTAAPDPTDRTYLILNLTDGSYRYMAAPPAGGWKSDPAYYQTNIVFRRIPAGTAMLGLPTDLRNHVNVLSSRKEHSGPHKATLSSDYYMAVYLTTSGQHDYVMARAAGTTKDVSAYSAVKGSVVSYDGLRGLKANGIDWPNTQYAVAEDSTIAAYREVVAGTFSTDWIVDLPSTVQWERAARATTPTNWLWSSGGTVEDSLTVISNRLAEVAICPAAYGSNIGLRNPNGWGLYDMIGYGYVWTLDWYENATASYSGTDPVGPTSGTYRTRRSATSETTGTMDYFLTAIIGTNGSTTKHNYRLCIHLKSLFRNK